MTWLVFSSLFSLKLSVHSGNTDVDGRGEKPLSSESLSAHSRKKRKRNRSAAERLPPSGLDGCTAGTSGGTALVSCLSCGATSPSAHWRWYRVTYSFFTNGGGTIAYCPPDTHTHTHPTRRRRLFSDPRRHKEPSQRGALEHVEGHVCRSHTTGG